MASYISPPPGICLATSGPTQPSPGPGIRYCREPTTRRMTKSLPGLTRPAPSTTWRAQTRSPTTRIPAMSLTLPPPASGPTPSTQSPTCLPTAPLRRAIILRRRQPLYRSRLLPSHHRSRRLLRRRRRPLARPSKSKAPDYVGSLLNTMILKYRMRRWNTCAL